MKSINITLPKIGESTTEAKIVEWLKKPGELIQKDEMFVIIGTDKVDSELFSEYEGVLKEIFIQNGEECLVGQTIATMEVSEDTLIINENLPSSLPSSNESSQTTQISLLDRSTELNFLSPVVRRIAAENNLSLQDLQKINGSVEYGSI